MELYSHIQTIIKMKSFESLPLLFCFYFITSSLVAQSNTQVVTGLTATCERHLKAIKYKWEPIKSNLVWYQVTIYGRNPKGGLDRLKGYPDLTQGTKYQQVDVVDTGVYKCVIKAIINKKPSEKGAYTWATCGSADSPNQPIIIIEFDKPANKLYLDDTLRVPYQFDNRTNNALPQVEVGVYLSQEPTFSSLRSQIITTRSLGDIAPQSIKADTVAVSIKRDDPLLQGRNAPNNLYLLIKYGDAVFPHKISIRRR